MHYCGDGISVDENGRFFRIANAFAGESVDAEIVSIRRRKQAWLNEVIESSPQRCTPICPNWKSCPACQFACLNTDAQERLKNESWMKLLRRFVDIPETCTVEFESAVETLKYRHRTDAIFFRTNEKAVFGIWPRLDAAVVQIRQFCSKTGLDVPDFTAIEADEIMTLPGIEPVSLHDCALHCPELCRLIDKTALLAEKAGFENGTKFGFEANGEFARVTIYAMPELAEKTRSCAEKLHRDLDISVIFQCLPPRGSHVYPKPEAFGSPWYCYGYDGDSSPLYALKGAWTPVNPVNAGLIRKTLDRFLGGHRYRQVLEIGCGCGTHSALFAAHADAYTGIDAAWPAILSAQHNAEINGWQNAVFYTDTAEHYLDKRYFSGRRAEAILMHSNRMPYSKKTAELCRRFGAGSMFIVAPTAFALAQECEHFAELGYHLERLTLCNTLPMTYHQMGVALMQL